ncbi:MAG: ribonuclease P protein component [Bacillota bacterium]|jgi:ribonuclease P protein component|nr:ribonuclease P protein component [Lentimicrobiaceae bacterium]MDI9482722.1 ribonuclease P protein component [Bacillota bacterium]NLV64220.1 ribonuclease P protein component [Clostridiaceae bacterium]
MGRIHRLKKNVEFQRIYRKGSYIATKALVAYVKPNNLKETRIGITVSKKYGKSVKRNRIRRLIIESYRLLKDKVKPGYDIVFVARKPDTYDTRLYNIHAMMSYILDKLNVLKRD